MKKTAGKDDKSISGTLSDTLSEFYAVLEWTENGEVKKQGIAYTVVEK
ncbi:MAG: hypothetical protein ACOX2F_07110 [bacterium]